MAASRLLHAVAACVILLSFAAGLRKSYWSDCMKAATVICQQIFSILALVIFLLKIFLKSAWKSSFFRSGVEIRFWSYNFDAIARSSLAFCNSVSADRIGMAASRSFEGSLARNAFLALVIFLLKILLKSASNRLFFARATISDAVARSSIVFCNSVSADRIVMAVSRLLRAVAACVILLSFAAGLRKSYWSGCMKAATVICQQIFSILALVIFLLKILLKSAWKSSFFRSGVEIHPVLELQFPMPLRVVLLCFATQSPQIALEWLRQGCFLLWLHA